MPIVTSPKVVITGGGSGLGRAFALYFARHGGRSIVCDRNEDTAKETVELIRKEGGEAYAEQCDVAHSDEVERMREVARERLGGADVIINNAGVAVAGVVGDVPLRDWEWIVSINLMGVVYGCHHFVPMFRAQGSGHIINVASAAGLAQAPEMAPYNVTKTGVISLSETLAAELAGSNVGVTVLCPSFFKTNLLDGSRNHGPQDTGPFVTKLMEKSKVQADDVVRVAVRAAEKNELYALPHLEGRAIWAIKRVMPSLYHQAILPRIARKMR
jgi:NAD(P)-dependent dehydrogenase (short-subunit alcohol dehydrogenase family)